MSPQFKKIACPPSPPSQESSRQVPKQEESEREERSAGYKWKHHRVSESRSCLSPLLLLLSQPIIIYWAFNPPPLLPLPPVARMVKEIVSETFLHGKVQGWILLTSSHSSRSLPPPFAISSLCLFFPTDEGGRKKASLVVRSRHGKGLISKYWSQKKARPPHCEATNGAGSANHHGRQGMQKKDGDASENLVFAPMGTVARVGRRKVNFAAHTSVNASRNG